MPKLDYSSQIIPRLQLQTDNLMGARTANSVRSEIDFEDSQIVYEPTHYDTWNMRNTRTNKWNTT